MNFPRMSSTVSDPASDNLCKLSTLFPSVVKDGQVDFEALKAELGQFEEVGKERYELIWAGKQEAMKNAIGGIEGKTLKYIPEESKNPETTENLYIEGDNLEVLKILQNSYMGKIKLIYIDPPYNTGSDFVYRDNFRQTEGETAVEEGDAAESGERYKINPKSSGKYHSKWLSMMYPRLRLAKNLLKNDGLIFISIDDIEAGNLREICDEIFGVNNFRGQITRATGTPTGQGNATLVNEIDYMLVYAKSDDAVFFGLPLNEEDVKIYNLQDEDGQYLIRPLRKTGGEDRKADRPSMYFAVTAPDGTSIYPIGPTGYESRWRCSEKQYHELEKVNRIEWKKSGGVWKVYQKFYLEGRTKQASNLWTQIEGNKKATITMRDILGKDIFDFPKPVGLLKQVIAICSKSDDIIFDFFSGSATTAHAVMQLNAEDGGNRKFIMVQYPEECPEDSEAAEAGYRTISDIGKERIRRAGEKIAKERPEAKIDTGFKVFKVDNTNIRWIAAENKIGDTTLADAITTTGKDLRDFLPNTKDVDVVYEILIRQYDMPLSAKIEKLSAIGPRTYSIADALIVCLEENVTSETIDTIAAIEPVPHKIIFRDSAFDDDIALKENTMMRLDALMQKHARDGKQPYRVEFL